MKQTLVFTLAVLANAHSCGRLQSRGINEIGCEPKHCVPLCNHEEATQSWANGSILIELEKEICYRNHYDEYIMRRCSEVYGIKTDKLEIKELQVPNDVNLPSLIKNIHKEIYPMKTQVESKWIALAQLLRDFSEFAGTKEEEKYKNISELLSGFYYCEKTKKPIFDLFSSANEVLSVLRNTSESIKLWHSFGSKHGAQKVTMEHNGQESLKALIDAFLQLDIADFIPVVDTIISLLQGKQWSIDQNELSKIFSKVLKNVIPEIESRIHDLELWDSKERLRDIVESFENLAELLEEFSTYEPKPEFKPTNPVYHFEFESFEKTTFYPWDDKVTQLNDFFVDLQDSLNDYIDEPCTKASSLKGCQFKAAQDLFKKVQTHAVSQKFLHEQRNKLAENAKYLLSDNYPKLSFGDIKSTMDDICVPKNAKSVSKELNAILQIANDYQNVLNGSFSFFADTPVNKPTPEFKNIDVRFEEKEFEESRFDEPIEERVESQGCNGGSVSCSTVEIPNVVAELVNTDLSPLEDVQNDSESTTKYTRSLEYKTADIKLKPEECSKEFIAKQQQKILIEFKKQLNK